MQIINKYMKRCSTLLIIREMKIKIQWSITSHQLEWLLSKKSTMNAGRMWKGWNPPTLLVGMRIGTATGGASGNELTYQCRRQKRQVQSQSQEDPLEEGMETLCSILAWRIPWTEECGGLQSIGSQRIIHNWSSLARTIENSIEVSLKN